MKQTRTDGNVLQIVITIMMRYNLYNPRQWILQPLATEGSKDATDQISSSMI